MSNGIRDNIQKPYFVSKHSLPGLDFNRELHAPGTYEKFPEGVVGIRVDTDFWSVAALPWEYNSWSLRDLVAELWPEYIDEASFEPDAGSVEQQIHFANEWAQSEKHRHDWVWKALKEADAELDRLRAGRLDLHERHPKRRKAFDNYFMRQYEHLLVVFAHQAQPRTDEMKGVCSQCGLFIGDRVHMKKYVDLRSQGFSYQPDHLAGMTNDEDED